jgi:hypothetical protein
MTGQRALAYVPLLLLAVVGLIAVLRSGPSTPPELPTTPAPNAPPASSAARPSEPQPAGTAGAPLPLEAGPPMTSAELRDFHVRLAHEQCEDGARRLNHLEGRADSDPQVLTRLSVCLRIGNVAWYKCMLRATTASEAHVCGQRFLSLDNPAPLE